MACFVDWKVPILTSKGWKPILEVEVGDLVLTHNGRFRRVSRLIRQSVTQAEVVVLRVNVAGGRQNDSLTMTIEHPVLTQRGWICAGDLTYSDQIAVVTQPCVVCGRPVIVRYRGAKACSRSCVGVLAATGLHLNEKAHKRAIMNMTKTHRKMWERGEHPFQDSQIRKIAIQRALRANSKLRSSKTEGVLAVAFDAMGLEYETQYPIPSKKVGKHQYYYYTDFAFPEQHVVVEADGEPWHSWDEKRVEHDKIRQACIEQQGWQVLRYTGAEIKSGAKQIAQEVSVILMNHSGQFGRAWVSIKSMVDSRSSKS